MFQILFYNNILEAAMTSQSQHDRLTLQEYMQTYNIRKKIEQRKKSKQKNQSPLILSQQQAKMKGIFTMIDQFNQQTKIELEDILLNTNNRPDRIFFYLSKTLDQLMMKIKGHITKMYEDVYRYIQVQNSQSIQNKSKEDVADYLKNKMVIAKEEKKKSNMGQVVKQNFKNQDKNAFLAKLIMGKTINNNIIEEPKQQNIKQASSVNKQPVKVTITRLKSAEPQRIKQNITQKVQQNAVKRQTSKNPQVILAKKQQPVVIQKKQGLPPLPPELSKQPRMNSFMQALFGAFQKQPQKQQVENPPPIESEIDENKKKQMQKQSKLSTIKQFQRKRSVKEMLKSPKAQILLNRSPYH